MRSSNLQVPTIIITGNAKADMREACLSAGAVAYLTKPLDSELLASTIEAALG
jgi:CheY-like chemotaxis protein